MPFFGWYRCSNHNISYPSGDLCPRCESEIQARQDKALAVNWKDVIPLDLHLDFMRDEQVYCRDEEHAFFTFSGRDLNKKEWLRTAVLEKRAEFLKMYALITIKINEEQLNVYKSKSGD